MLHKSTGVSPGKHAQPASRIARSPGIGLVRNALWKVGTLPWLHYASWTGTEASKSMRPDVDGIGLDCLTDCCAHWIGCLFWKTCGTRLWNPPNNLPIPCVSYHQNWPIRPENSSQALDSHRCTINTHQHQYLGGWSADERCNPKNGVTLTDCNLSHYQSRVMSQKTSRN